MDLGTITVWIGIAASLALVISVCLLAYNLMATRRDARRNLAFSLMEQLTSENFAQRRWKMRHWIATAEAAGWAGYDDTLEDFESRAFAYQYELIGQMVRAGTLEYEQVRDFLQHSILSDWVAFQPLNRRLVERYQRGPEVSPFERFRTLAEQIGHDLGSHRAPPPPLPATAPRPLPEKN